MPKPGLAECKNNSMVKANTAGGNKHARHLKSKKATPEELAEYQSATQEGHMKLRALWLQKQYEEATSERSHLVSYRHTEEEWGGFPSH